MKKLLMTFMLLTLCSCSYIQSLAESFKKDAPIEQPAKEDK